MPLCGRLTTACEGLKVLLQREQNWERMGKTNQPFLLCGGAPGIGKSRLEAELPNLICEEARKHRGKTTPLLQALAENRYIHVRLLFCLLSSQFACELIFWYAPMHMPKVPVSYNNFTNIMKGEDVASSFGARLLFGWFSSEDGMTDFESFMDAMTKWRIRARVALDAILGDAFQSPEGFISWHSFQLAPFFLITRFD